MTQQANNPGLSAALVKQVLAGLGSGFNKADFVRALSSLGVTLTADKARQELQRLKRQSQITYDPIKKIWSPVTSHSGLSQPVQTLPMIGSDKPHSFSLPRQTQSDASAGFLARLSGLLHGSITHLACLAAILALVAINASFAWNLGETDGFRYPFVIGLMACDLMRPLLIARGLWDFAHRHVMRGFFAFVIALSLAPLSILSSTSVISASLFLGAEQNERTEISNEVRTNLQLEYQRLQGLVERQWQDWQTECKRGGCGSRAARLAETAKATEEEAKQRLGEIVNLVEDANQSSQFISRAVKSFEALGLFGANKLMFIPLLLALTLELAALFGPGLLLARKE